MEGLNAVLRVNVGSVEFPAKAVVQGDVRFDFPTVLGKEVQGGGADILALGGALRIRERQTQKIVGIGIHRIPVGIGQAHIICAARLKGVVAVDIEIEELIEALAADIHAELGAVLADDLAEVVGPLEGVADLRQLAFKIVSDDETAGDVNERHALAAGNIRGDPGARIVRIGEAIRRGNTGAAGIMQAGQDVDRVIETALAFAEIVEAKFVHGG